MPLDKDRNWLYKDGKAELFEGDEILKKVEEGWTDSPDTPSPKSGKEGAASGAVTTKAATSGAITKKIGE